MRPEEVEYARQFDAADYVDVFGLEQAGPVDERSPEQWTRSAFDNVPAAWRTGIGWAHRQLLRFRLASSDDPDHVVGWRIIESSATVLRLEATGSLMHGTLCVVRASPTRAQLVTALVYKRPLLARAVWALVGPVHRRAAPLLMERAASASAPGSNDVEPVVKEPDGP